MTGTCLNSTPHEVMSKWENSYPEMLNTLTWPRVFIDEGKVRVFKNAHCASCNGMNENDACILEINFICPRDTDYIKIIENYDNLVLGNFTAYGCSIYFNPTKCWNLTSPIADQSCYREPNNDQYLSEKVFDYNMCHAFHHPIIQDGVIYKNPFCLMSDSFAIGSVEYEYTNCISSEMIRDNGMKGLDRKFGFSYFC